MGRLRPGRRAGLAAIGAIAGLAGALAMTAFLFALRLGVGIPLPVESFTDFYLPTVQVDDFLEMLNKLGGFVAAKKIAVIASTAAQLGVGLVLGAAYSLLRPRGLRVALGAVGGLLLVLWAAFVALLWQELDANFRGIGPSLARLLTVVTVLVAFALFVTVTAWVHHVLRRRAPEARVSPAASGEGAREGLGRRDFLVAGGVGALALVTGGLASTYWRGSVFGYDGKSAVAPGIAPVTPNDRFYVVTKNLVDPHLWESAWALEVDGAVDAGHTYDYAELAALPPVAREITLECISNGVGGGLMSNAKWRGVPLRTLLSAARPHSDASQVFLHGADGFTHELSMEKAMSETTIVAYEMNGEPLPHRHGFPARVLVPGAYGELSVKWVVRVEVQTGGQQGFYPRQGWKADRVSTTSRIDSPRRNERVAAGRAVTVSGVAFSGDRGISSVELSVDGGRTWTPATIDYHPTPTAWALWSAPWTPAGAGTASLMVRATDGEGEPQIAKEQGIAPSGSKGHHHRDVVVTAA